MEMINGQIQFSFSLGSTTTRVQAGLKTALNDGNWHEVTVEYYNRVSSLLLLLLLLLLLFLLLLLLLAPIIRQTPVLVFFDDGL